MTTIREHIEELRPLHTEGGGRCIWCETKWPCGHSVTLDAAIAAIDTAEWENFRPSSGMRLVPDVVA